MSIHANGLLKEIEKYRMEMVQLACSTSLGNQKVIEISKELDTLLNRYDSDQKRF